MVLYWLVPVYNPQYTEYHLSIAFYHRSVLLSCQCFPVIIINHVPENPWIQFYKIWVKVSLCFTSKSPISYMSHTYIDRCLYQCVYISIHQFTYIDRNRCALRCAHLSVFQPLSYIFVFVKLVDCFQNKYLVTCDWFLCYRVQTRSSIWIRLAGPWNEAGTWFARGRS